MSISSYLNLKDSRFWCWWGAWDTHFKDNMSFWSMFLHYSPGILIPSDYSFCYGPVQWAAVQCAVTKRKHGLTFASTGSLVSFQKLLFLVPHCNALKVFFAQNTVFQGLLNSKSSIFKTTRQNQIRFTFEHMYEALWLHISNHESIYAHF